MISARAVRYEPWNLPNTPDGLQTTNTHQFYHAYRSLCPKAWTDRWDGQRGMYPTTRLYFRGPILTYRSHAEGGNFPAILDR